MVEGQKKGCEGEDIQTPAGVAEVEPDEEHLFELSASEM